MRKTLASVLASLALLIPFQKTSACTGAREAAMGFAGVAESRGSQTTYWNPAGLAENQNELSFTHTFDDSLDLRYDDVLALNKRLGSSAGMGLHCVDSDKYSGNEQWRWLRFGAGLKIFQNDSNKLLLGGAVNFKRMEETQTGVKRKKNTTDYSVSALFERKTNIGELRLATLLAKTEGLEGEEYFNLRPGASFTPDALKDSTISIEFYDTLKNGFNGIRTGIEHRIGKFVLRAGYNSLGEKFFTFGAGYDYGKWGIDIAGNNKGTCIVGLKRRF